MTIKNLQVVIEVVEVCLICYLSDKWLKINQLAPIITLKKRQLIFFNCVSVVVKNKSRSKNTFKGGGPPLLLWISEIQDLSEKKVDSVFTLQSLNKVRNISRQVNFS